MAISGNASAREGARWFQRVGIKPPPQGHGRRVPATRRAVRVRHRPGSLFCLPDVGESDCGDGRVPASSRVDSAPAAPSNGASPRCVGAPCLECTRASPQDCRPALGRCLPYRFGVPPWLRRVRLPCPVSSMPRSSAPVPYGRHRSPACGSSPPSLGRAPSATVDLPRSPTPSRMALRKGLQGDCGRSGSDDRPEVTVSPRGRPAAAAAAPSTLPPTPTRHGWYALPEARSQGGMDDGHGSGPTPRRRPRQRGRDCRVQRLERRQHHRSDVGGGVRQVPAAPPRRDGG